MIHTVGIWYERYDVPFITSVWLWLAIKTFFFVVSINVGFYTVSEYLGSIKATILLP